MIVTHELGHAMLRLYYGYDGDDQPRSQTFAPPAFIPAFSPPQGSSCINVSSYGMNSLEWNSQAFKEAFADFYSAKVWNEKDGRGTYTYRGAAYDLLYWNYNEALEYAIENSVPSLSACEQTGYNAYAEWNGVF